MQRPEKARAILEAQAANSMLLGMLMMRFHGLAKHPVMVPCTAFEKHFMGLGGDTTGKVHKLPYTRAQALVPGPHL